MVDLREGGKEDFNDMIEVLVPAFSDKALAILGDEEMAGRLLPFLLKDIKGFNMVAFEKEKVVGAIVISYEEIRITPELARMLRKEGGLFRTVKAARLMKSYEKSLPRRLDKEARLEVVAVKEEFRARGIGSKLISEAESKLRANGKSHFGLSVKVTNPAVRLYERLGFEKIDSFANKLGNWLYMRKKLVIP